MANVKAGVAYVDVRLGSIEQFKQRMASEVEKVGTTAGKKISDKMKEELAPEATKVGQTVGKNFGGSFFSEANRSFGGGLNALAHGNLRAFGSLMKRGAAEAAQGFKNTFIRGATGIGNFFSDLPNRIRPALNAVSSGAINAFKSIPRGIAAAGKAVDDFGKRLGFLAFQLQGFGVIASVAFTAPVAAAATLATVVGIKTAASFEQATASLKALTPAGTDVEALLKRLQKLAQESPIFNTADVVGFTQKMVASGLSVKTVEKFLKGFGNVALSVGADVGKIPFALEAMVQMVGKGKVSMEELRLQLGDALPGAMKLVSDGLGITTKKLYEMVEAGKLTGEDIIQAFIKLGNSKKYLDGAGKGADTLGAKFQQLKESLQTQLGNTFLEHAPEIKKALDELGPSLSELIKLSGPLFTDMVKGFSTLVQKIGELIKWYQNLDPSQRDMVNKLMLIAVVLGPLVLLLSGLGMVLAGLTAFFAAVATPVGLVVAALIIFGIEVTAAVKYLKNLYAEGGKFKEVWDRIWAATVELIKPVIEEFKKLWETVKQQFQQIKNAFAEQSASWESLWMLIKFVGAVIGAIIATVAAVIFGFIKGIVSALGNVIGVITSIISGAVKIIGGILSILIGIFTLDFEKIKSGLTSLWNGLWDLVVGTIWNAIQAIYKFIKGFVTGIVDFFKWLYNVLVGHSIIPDMVNKILDWFKRMVQRGVQFVKDLGKPFVAFYNSYIKPFVDGVGRGINKVLEFIGNMPGKIKSFFSNAAGWLVSAGANIVNGLISGVRSMGGTLKNAILGLIPGPVKGVVEKALGINSPSRVFMEYGKNVVLGFIRGITAFQPRMISTVDGAFAFATPGVSPSFGDARQPIVERGSAPEAAVKIENYNTNDTDPDRVAEDLWWKIQGRGGGF
jgi:tape measure domain-containing protein